MKPITTSKESLKVGKSYFFILRYSLLHLKFQIKPSSAFTKALEELIYHQKLLSDPQELERVIAESKSKKPAKKTISPVVPVAKTPKKKGKQPVNQTASNNSTTKRKQPVTSNAKQISSVVRNPK